MPKPYSRVAFVAADAQPAREALDVLTRRYGQHKPEDADVIVALGGDGFMLEAVHTYMKAKAPIFGMHRGTVGFLMNRYEENDLLTRLQNTTEVTLHPLRMTAVTAGGETFEAAEHTGIHAQGNRSGILALGEGERACHEGRIQLMSGPVGGFFFGVGKKGNFFPGSNGGEGWGQRDSLAFRS